MKKCIFVWVRYLKMVFIFTVIFETPSKPTRNISLGTGHNKFVQRGPTLYRIVGYRRHHLSHEHYRQKFFGFKI